MTLDLDFGDVRHYPPSQHSGLVILRLKRQDKHTILALIRRLAMALDNRTPAGELWIVEKDRIRFRAGH